MRGLRVVLWSITAVLVLAGSLLAGPAAAGDVVDGALFTVVFMLALVRRAGAAWIPAALVTVAGAGRMMVAGLGASVPAVAFVTLMRYLLAAILLLLALAVSARRPVVVRVWDCLVVGAAAWAGGALLAILAGLPCAAGGFRYLAGSGLTGAGLGLWCVTAGLSGSSLSSGGKGQG